MNEELNYEDFDREVRNLGDRTLSIQSGLIKAYKKSPNFAFHKCLSISDYLSWKLSIIEEYLEE